MTPEEQKQHCEKCEHHKIISAGCGIAEINIMSCSYGEYRNHPVLGDFKCPQGKEDKIAAGVSEKEENKEEWNSFSWNPDWL